MQSSSPAGTPAFETAELFGLPLARVTFREALGLCKSWLKESTPHHIITADATMVLEALDDARLKELLARAALIVPDGFGVVWAAHRLGMQLPERVPGCELAERLCIETADLGTRFYFLGGAPGVAAEAAERLREKYPTLQIVGTRHGYYTEQEESEIVTEIVALRPDVLYCALGIPKQEFFIAKYANQLGAKLLMGVGGTLDVLSGRVKRAPRLFQNLHLEWLYRTLGQPRKRLPRALKLARLVWLTAQERRRIGQRQKEQPADG